MNVSTLLPRSCGRIILRRIAEDDLARFQAYRTDPEVARYQDWEQLTDDDARLFIRHMYTAGLLQRGSWSQIGIAESTNGYLIGDIGIHIDAEEHEAEIGYTIDRQYQRRGYGREAVAEAIRLIFEKTTIKRVIGITDTRNLASINLMKALGMELIATVDTVFKGEPCTEMTFSILNKQ